MIDAKELRIGNWVYSMQQAEYVMVYGILPDKIYIEKEDLWEPERKFSGIELTTVILEKFGFKDMDMNIDIWDNGIQICRLPATYKYYFCIADGSTLSIINESEFEYVHQLQNLYFCLTGKELEIKL